MQLLSLRVKTIVNFIRSPWRKPILKSRRDFKQQLQLSQKGDRITQQKTD